MKFTKVFLMAMSIFLVFGLVACGSSDPTQAPATTAAASDNANKTEATAEPADSDAAAPGAAAPGEFGDPASALDSAESYSLHINAAGMETTFEFIKSKNQYHIINGAEGMTQEMYVIEDKLYTLTGGMCVGVDAGDQLSGLEQLGDISAYTAGMTGDELVGAEEVNGVKADHFRSASEGATVDTWVAQEGNYLVRMTMDNQGQKVEINVTNINALSAFELPESCNSSLGIGGVEIPSVP